jgi:hypothetical protein
VLLDPPTVEGYKAGPTWINSATMLARTNFVSGLLDKRRDDFVGLLAAQGAAVTRDPALILDFCLRRMGVPRLNPAVRDDLVAYLRASTGATWTGSASQLGTKVPVLIHLISGAAEYTFG